MLKTNKSNDVSNKSNSKCLNTMKIPEICVACAFAWTRVFENCNNFRTQEIRFKHDVYAPKTQRIVSLSFQPSILDVGIVKRLSLKIERFSVAFERHLPRYWITWTFLSREQSEYPETFLLSYFIYLLYIVNCQLILTSMEHKLKVIFFAVVYRSLELLTFSFFRRRILEITLTFWIPQNCVESSRRNWIDDIVAIDISSVL